MNCEIPTFRDISSDSNCFRENPADRERERNRVLRQENRNMSVSQNYRATSTRA